MICAPVASSRGAQRSGDRRRSPDQLNFNGRQTGGPPVAGPAAARRRSLAHKMRLHRVRVSVMSAVESTRRLAGAGTSWSPLSSAMRAVQSSLGRKAAEKLAAITTTDPKTAQRNFSGKRRPNGETVRAIVAHPVAGIAFIQEATRLMPPAEHHDYWCRMAVAVGDALRERDVAL